MCDLDKKVAESLLQIKAIKLNPTNHFTWASGWYSPIYCDNRKILSYPAVRKEIYEGFVKIISEKYPDADIIAGVATELSRTAYWSPKKWASRLSTSAARRNRTG